MDLFACTSVLSHVCTFLHPNTTHILSLLKCCRVLCMHLREEEGEREDVWVELCRVFVPLKVCSNTIEVRWKKIYFAYIYSQNPHPLPTLLQAAKDDLHQLLPSLVLLGHHPDEPLRPDPSHNKAGSVCEVLEGCTALHFAVKYSTCAECVTALLDSGASPSPRNAEGYTPLHFAIMCGQGHLVSLLVRRGASLESDIQQSPLVFAVNRDFHHIAKTLLQYSCEVPKDVVTPITSRRMSLILSSSDGVYIYPAEDTAQDSMEDNNNDVHIVSDLEDHHESSTHNHTIPKSPKMHVSEALHAAIRGKHLNSTDVLLKYSADANARDGEKRTALHIACEYAEGNTEILDLLLSHGGDITAIDARGYNILHTACDARDLHVIQYLLQRLSHSDVRDNILNGLSYEGWTPLHVAIRSSRKRWQVMHVAEELVCAGAYVDVEAIIGQNESSLSATQEIFHNVFVEDFMENLGVLITKPQGVGKSVLHTALGLQKPEIVQKLLQYRPHLIHTTNVNEDTAIMYTLKNELDITGELIPILLQADDREAPQTDNEGNTPLHVATTATHVRHILSRYPACMEAKNHVGETPLFRAVVSNRTPVIEALMRAGADTCASNNAGDNVLHVLMQKHVYECRETPFSIVEEFSFDSLEILGPNFYFLCALKNNEGDTPLDLLCKDREKAHAMNLLRNFKKKAKGRVPKPSTCVIS